MKHFILTTPYCKLRFFGGGNMGMVVTKEPKSNCSFPHYYIYKKIFII